MLRDLLRHDLPERWGICDPGQVQVLTPMNRGPLGTQQLNEDLRELFTHGQVSVLDFGQRFKLGDKVMITRNDYSKNIFNGDMGFVRHVDRDLQLVEVDIGGRSVGFNFNELDDLTLAYAISIHKSQGSEYRAVIVVLTEDHLPLAQRHLIYTAVTRARESVFLVAEPAALQRAISNSPVRWQKLSELLSA